MTAFQRFGKLAAFGRLGYADVDNSGLPSPTPARLAATVGSSLDGLWDGIDDRLAMAYTWAEPADRTLNDQHAIDAFYHMQLTPEIEFGPSLQVIFDPVNRPSGDTVVVGGLRIRIVF